MVFSNRMPFTLNYGSKIIMKLASNLVLCVLVLFLSATYLHAQQSNQEQIDETERQLKELEKKRLELEKKKSELKRKQLELLKKKRDELDKQIKNLEANEYAHKKKPDSEALAVPAPPESLVAPSKSKAAIGKPLGSNVPAGFSVPAKQTAPKPSLQPTAATNPNRQTTQPRTTKQSQSIDDILNKIALNTLDNLHNTDNTPQIDLTLQSANVLKLFSEKISTDEKKLKTEIEKEVLDDKKNEETILDTEAVRNDKLVGATSESPGTTNLVSNGGVPLIFSLATEHGAATSSTSGTNTTFQFNPIGLTNFLTGGLSSTNSGKSTCESETGFRKHLCRTSFGITFDLSSDVETPTFIGSREQLSQISFRYAFVTRKEPSIDEFKTKTKAFVDEVVVPTSTNQFKSLDKLLDGDQNFTNPTLLIWLNDTNAELKELADIDNSGKREESKLKIKKVIARRLKELPVDEIKNSTEVVDALNQFENADALYRQAEEEYLKDLYRQWQFTFEYVNNRLLDSPDSSNFKLIAEKGFGSGIDFTFNGSFSFFHERPEATGMITAANLQNFKRLRDFSFATQVDIPLFGVSNLENSTLSLAAKYQRMNTDVFVFNDMTFNNLEGDVWVGQAKLNLGIGKSGFFLPLSFTYANRSELNKEKESRGNFGFTFDISSMIQRYLGGVFKQ